MRRRWIWMGAILAGMLMTSGCGYLYYTGALKPADEALQETGAEISDDGTVTFIKDRLEVSLRPMTDEELNRQFAAASKKGAKSTNPYTYGDSKYWDIQKTPQRFTVFRLKVKNYQYPKARLDPLKIVIVADNGREYGALSLAQLKLYYGAYIIGYRGNEYQRYEDRKDILEQSMYPGDPIFSGQEQEGYVVFPPLHPDVRRITVWVRDMVLRFDFREEPVETLDIRFSFEREIGRIYAEDRIELLKG
ncbi:TPA: hypothetical protein EYP37_05355 [Candidatus Poribacteria bacterium]|nr:hypothetical protein [Candidatus Poribacteria bacterium]